MGHAVTFNYAVRDSSYGPKAISVNGKAVQFTYEENKYRQGGAIISADKFLARLNQQDNMVEIRL
jgi:hypothetical protein